MPTATSQPRPHPDEGALAAAALRPPGDPAAADVRRHVASCRECASALDAYRVLHALTRPDFRDAAPLRTEQYPAAPPPQRRWLVPTLVAALAVAVAVAAYGLLR